MKKRKFKKTQEAQSPSLWEVTYTVTASKLYKSGKVAKQNIVTLAKFLSVFIIIFSFPYMHIKKIVMKSRLAKIHSGISK